MATLTCDVDDTLVDARGDQIERTVAYVNAHRGRVVILTARREGRRAETERQLRGVRYDELIMRQDRTAEVPYKINAMKKLLAGGEVAVAIDNAPGVRAAFERLGVRALSPDRLSLRETANRSDGHMSEELCASIPSTLQEHVLSDILITEASDGRPLVEQLPELLANVVTMYHLAHGAHWNVKGEGFSQYHEFFGEIYEDVLGAIDPVAEALLKLGHDAPFAMSDLVARRSVEDPAGTPDTAEDMARMLLTVNEGVLSSLSRCCDQANSEDQQGIVNLLADRIDMHQKWGWQLRASLGVAGAPSMEDMGEAVGSALSPAMRRRHATIVRTLPDGSKEYKFPIPDKAHARAALAYVHRSDLTAAERAKVISRAYKMLGTKVPDQMKESAELITSTTTSTTPDADVVYTTSTGAVLAEGAADGEQEFVEATHPSADSSLDHNEMVVTIIQPGANRSGSRFYPRETIAEAVTQGMFNGRKMFVNHASATEMRDRPERSLTDWVSTIKETWIDPETGAAQARIKIVQNWFGDFLKQLQENEALPDIGLSIFAQGKVQRKKVDGRLTDVVERFTRALSVDWVTEPGAGGRVNAIWESYQPVRLKEQEINVLNTMTVTEAVTTLREQRPDIIEALEGEQTPRLDELQSRIAELEAELEARDAAVAEAAQAAAKAEQDVLVSEAIGEADLPQAARERVAEAVKDTFLTEDNKLDREAAEARVKELIEAEKAYAEQLLAEARPAGGRGIAGLGDRQEPAPSSTIDKVEADIARRMGVKVAEAEQA